jgi:hypothetical protein
MEEAKLEGITSCGVASLGGEYETVTTKKRGTVFVEARIRDDTADEVDIASVVCPYYIS